MKVVLSQEAAKRKAERATKQAVQGESLLNRMTDALERLQDRRCQERRQERLAEFLHRVETVQVYDSGVELPTSHATIIRGGHPRGCRVHEVTRGQLVIPRHLRLDRPIRVDPGNIIYFAGHDWRVDQVDENDRELQLSVTQIR